ncbi:MAG: hypothetical protein CMH79_03890, partial [Nitrospinae bacterium]|nr:hypothetical protein [Nitrospinota bacterium]
MAAKHILSLEVPQVANCEILKIQDTSQYADNLAVDCAQLVITYPGSIQINVIDVQPGFDLNINACALNLQTTGCQETRSTLPDGIYIIRY